MASPAFGNLVSSYGLKSNGMAAMDVVAGVPVRITNYQGNPTVYIYAKDKQTASLIASNMKDAAKNAGIPDRLLENVVLGRIHGVIVYEFAFLC